MFVPLFFLLFSDFIIINISTGRLGARNNTFLPQDFRTGPFQYVAAFVPIVKSRYGTLAPGSKVGGHALKAGSPFVWTSYDVPIGLG